MKKILILSIIWLIALGSYAQGFIHTTNTEPIVVSEMNNEVVNIKSSTDRIGFHTYILSIKAKSVLTGAVIAVFDTVFEYSSPTTIDYSVYYYRQPGYLYWLDVECTADKYSFHKYKIMN